MNRIMNRRTGVFASTGILVLLLTLSGCQGERQETPTRGSLTMITSESVSPLVRLEVARFQELYQEAKIQLLEADAREAIARLYNDTIKVIVSSRPLNAEEIQIAKKTNLRLGSYKIAIDAIAIIVNEDNPLARLRTTQLDSIYSGGITRWDELGGKKAPVSLYAPGRNSGTYEVFWQKVLGGGNFSPGTSVVPSSHEMLQRISKDPSGIGMVGVNWLGEKPENVKVLELSDPHAPDSLGIRGQYFSPHQAHIYRGYYPLTRDIYIYSKADQYGVGAGFISFVTSAPGQKIVLNSGLVPATMPVRLVELTQRSLTP
jgi:phosphate transport system substrate-binding protein